VSSFFLVDDIADVDFFPRYDEYNDDYEIDFLENPTACSLSGSVQFQQSPGITHPTYCIYANGNEKNGEFTDENSLPLCFASFDLLKENFKITTKGKGCEIMQDHITSLEQTENKLQQPSHVFHDPITCYMECFNSQNFHPMISCMDINEDDGKLVPIQIVSSFSVDVLLQQSNAYFHISYDNLLSKSHERKYAGEGVNLWHINHLEQSCNMLDEYEINFQLFEDPFAVFLESVSELKLSDFSVFFNIEFVYKFLFELSLSKYCILFLNKNMQENKTVDKVIIWLY
jgi:hypothetical protein